MSEIVWLISILWILTGVVAHYWLWARNYNLTLSYSILGYLLAAIYGPLVICAHR